MSDSLTALILVTIYLLSLYPLVRMFVRMVKLVAAQPSNGLQFYRKMVTVSIFISSLDATYAIVTVFAYLYSPSIAGDLLIGLIPVILKSVIMGLVWGFYAIQLGKSDSLALAHWDRVLRMFFVV